MTAFSVSLVEGALRYWLTTSTGLDEDKVIWSDQSGNLPEGRFITLELSNFSSLSPHDERRYEAAHPAEELHDIDLRTGGPRELGVRVQAQSRDLYGTDGAFELARKSQLGLSLDQVRNRLGEAGLSVIDPGQPVRIRTLLDTRFVTRYALDPRFNASDEALEALAAIQHVHGSGTVNKPDGSQIAVPIEADVQPPPED